MPYPEFRPMSELPFYGRPMSIIVLDSHGSHWAASVFHDEVAIRHGIDDLVPKTLVGWKPA